MSFGGPAAARRAPHEGWGRTGVSSKEEPGQHESHLQVGSGGAAVQFELVAVAGQRVAQDETVGSAPPPRAGKSCSADGLAAAAVASRRVEARAYMVLGGVDLAGCWLCR